MFYYTEEFEAITADIEGFINQIMDLTNEGNFTNAVEQAEAHKIRAFIAMVRDVKAIGVPLPAADAGSGPAAAVEAWPRVGPISPPQGIPTSGAWQRRTRRAWRASSRPRATA